MRCIKHALVSPVSSQCCQPRFIVVISGEVLPRYFSSGWLFAQFHEPEVAQFFATFGANLTIAWMEAQEGIFFSKSIPCSLDVSDNGRLEKKTSIWAEQRGQLTSPLLYYNYHLRRRPGVINTTREGGEHERGYGVGRSS
uniref:Uncharacterized protein n=1 Tax=Brassica oleracea var. oleracea TaxID=109376 RepID=A0A0D3E287_BRAOL